MGVGWCGVSSALVGWQVEVGGCGVSSALGGWHVEAGGCGVSSALWWMAGGGRRVWCGGRRMLIVLAAGEADEAIIEDVYAQWVIGCDVDVNPQVKLIPTNEVGLVEVPAGRYQ